MATDDTTLKHNIMFGRYQVMGVLGVGGMGKVYKVLDITLQRVIALKVLLNSPHQSPQQIERFLLEAQAVAKLNHPNIVRIYDVGRQQDVYFFTMDYIEGFSLHELIHSKKINIRKGLKLIEKIADAIDYAHKQGIIHRDLKPANIMVDHNDNPYVMDFGLAKVQQSKKLTATGALIGTPNYMSPEQAQGEYRKVDEKSDVYSLGAVLYELLTGRPPFIGTNVTDVLAKICKTNLILPGKLNPRVGRELDGICYKAMSKNKEDRYSTAEDFAKDLRAYLDGKKVEGKVKPRLSLWATLSAALLAIIFIMISFPAKNPPKKSPYVGDTQNGKPHGNGIFTFDNGDKYVGEWKDGLQDGTGTFTQKDGNKYFGQWKQGKRHGVGTLYNLDGSINKKGTWHNDVFLEKDKTLFIHYDFEDDFPISGIAKDKSGNPYHIRMVGKVEQCPGISGKAALFSQGYFQCAPNPTAHLDKISVSLWFKTENPKKNHKLLASAWWQNGVGSGWLIGSTALEIWASDSSGVFKRPRQRAAFVADRWNHYVFTYDCEHLCEYINGEVSFKAEANGKKIGPGIALWVGRWAGYQFTGRIDEVKIYERILDEKEIQAMYQKWAENR